MSGQQIAAMQQQAQGAQPTQQFQQPPAGMGQFQSMPQQFAAMGGFPMPNPQAARWDNRPANTLVNPNSPGGSNWGAPSTVSQLQALQAQIANMRGGGGKSKEPRRSRDSLGTSG
jgi:hypothetical protein